MHRQYQDGDSTWKLQFMINRWSFYIGIVIIIGFISSAFKPINTINQKWFHVSENEELLYQFPSEKPSDYFNQSLPYLGKHFIGFKEAIAFYNRTKTELIEEIMLRNSLMLDGTAPGRDMWITYWDYTDRTNLQTLIILEGIQVGICAAGMIN